MSRPKIEPRSPGPLANTLLIRLMVAAKVAYFDKKFSRLLVYFLFNVAQEDLYFA